MKTSKLLSSCLAVVFIGCSAGAEQGAVSSADDGQTSEQVEASGASGSGQPSRCRDDDDCVMSTAPDDCCHPCGCSGVPYAIHRDDLEAQRERCALVECEEPEFPISCEPCPEEPPSSQAICENGGCVWMR